MLRKERKRSMCYILLRQNPLTPSVPQPVTESFNPSLENVWAERCTHMPENVIFSFPAINLLLVLFVLTEILACANARKKKGLTDFKFHFFIDCFQVT